MYIDEIYAARDYIQSRYKNPIDVAIVLGSGLVPLAEVINEPVEIDYKDITYKAEILERESRSVLKITYDKKYSREMLKNVKLKYGA